MYAYKNFFAPSTNPQFPVCMASATHHICLLVADPVVQTLWSHPFDRDPGSVVLTIVVCLVDISGQAKICHPHTQVLVNPVDEVYNN